MRNFFKSRTIQAALIGAVVFIAGWFVTTNRDGLGSVNQHGVINTVGQVGNNNLNIQQGVEPSIELRKMRSINVKTERGFEHSYILTLSNPSNADVKIAARASRDAGFKLIEFKYDTKYLVVNNGKSLLDLDAWVLTDTEISEDQIEFVIIQK